MLKVTQKESSTKTRRRTLLTSKDYFLDYYPSFISKPLADSAFLEIEQKATWRQDPIKVFGKEYLIPRLHSWIADSHLGYKYSGIDLPINPWFKEIQNLRERIQLEIESELNSCLLNFYRDGKDSNGWHSDNEKEIKPGSSIACISFGETRSFLIRKKGETKSFLKVEPEHGSLLVMGGFFQEHFQHQISKSARFKGPRMSLTFREMIE